MALIHPISSSVERAGELTGLDTWEVRDLCESGAVVSHFNGPVRLVDLESLRSHINSLPTERPA